jgi:hypothetical protein
MGFDAQGPFATLPSVFHCFLGVTIGRILLRFKQQQQQQEEHEHEHEHEYEHEHNGHQRIQEDNEDSVPMANACSTDWENAASSIDNHASSGGSGEDASNRDPLLLYQQRSNLLASSSSSSSQTSVLVWCQIRILSWAVMSGFLAWALAGSGAIPVNKNLWSESYVLVSAMIYECRFRFTMRMVFA